MRHTLRDAQVWAEVDDSGRLLADDGGRVSVVYKRDPAAKVYKAGARNLTAVAGAPVEADLGSGAPPAPAAAPSGRSARGSAAAAGKPPPAGNVGRAALGDRTDAATVHVWTDGACTGNPGPAALGVVVLDGAARREHAEFLGQGTNNIAELTAVLRGLELVDDPRRPVRVYTDSQYAIGVLAMGYKAKANVELIGDIKARLSQFADVRFVKVPGHAGVPENERCDQLARGAILSGRRR